MKRSLFVLTLVACVGAVVGSQVAGAGTARATALTIIVNDDFAVPTFKGDKDAKKCANPDFMTIGAGVAAANPGDTVKVCPGTYPENVNVDRKVNIVGIAPPKGNPQKSSAACLDAAGFPATDPTLYPIVTGGGIGFLFTANDATLRNMVLQDKDAGAQISAVTVMNTEIRNNIFQNNTIGVSLRGEDTDIVSNCFRTNNRAGGASGNGVYTDGATQSANYSNNTSTGHNSAGVNAIGDGLGSVDNFDIMKNLFVDDSDAVSFAGTTGSGSEIDGNNVNGTGVGGGSAFYFQADNHGVTISNNKITNSSDEGINIDSGGGARNDGFVLDRNNITNGATDGISVRADSLNNSLIIDNRVTANTDDGLEISDDNDGISVVNNNLKGNGPFAGSYDCFDGNTVPGENVWYKNQGNKQNQDGLCQGATTV